MNWTTFLTLCLQAAIATMVIRFCAEMIRGAITGKASTDQAPSIRDLVAKARAKREAKARDAALVDTSLDTPATEAIPAVDVTRG